jgi:hypothetical protein
MIQNGDLLQTIGIYLAGALGLSLLLALLLLLYILLAVRRIDVPPGADLTETLRHTPFIVVVMIDLLDLALDVLAAPFAWVILDRLGLKALRGVAAVEAFLPFTQIIPTMTLLWIGARLSR